jgi:hypothetical protein
VLGQTATRLVGYVLAAFAALGCLFAVLITDMASAQQFEEPSPGQPAQCLPGEERPVGVLLLGGGPAGSHEFIRVWVTAPALVNTPVKETLRSLHGDKGRGHALRISIGRIVKATSGEVTIKLDATGRGNAKMKVVAEPPGGPKTIVVLTISTGGRNEVTYPLTVQLPAIGVLVYRHRGISPTNPKVHAFSACTASVVQSNSGDVVLTVVTVP